MERLAALRAARHRKADVDMKFGKLIGAIDEGTSSARFIIFKAGSNEMVCSHQIEVSSIYPHEGWCEQDPLLIYQIVKECVEEAVKKLEQLGGSAKDIVGIGVTNQRESVIVWNRTTGKPLHNAIIWLDNRTTATVDDLVESIPNKSRNINYLQPLCGLPISPYFSAVKLRWLRDHVAAVRKEMEAGTLMFGTIDTWLIYQLTGGPHGGIHVTDVTNASRTMLMNIETLRWDSHLMEFFGLPASMLPEIRSSAEHYGDVSAIECVRGVPLLACMGDQQAALVGQQCLSRGLAKCTYGTGCFLLYNTGPTMVNSTHGLLTTVGYQLGPRAHPMYALEGSVAVAGVALSWMRDNLGLFEEIGDVEKMASTVKDSMDCYFVPAFSGLYAPYWNQEARGVICGLTEETTSEHLVHATLEAICFQVRDILDAMRKDCGIPLSKLMVDGGMTVNKLFLQLQADIVGISVIRSKISETTALGAALAAWKVLRPDFDIESPLHQIDHSHIFEAKAADDERDKRYSKWKMAVERAINWDMSAALAEGKRISIE